MNGLDALQSAQYVTAKGKRLVLLSLEDWEAMIEWLETLDDVAVTRQALGQLKAAGGDRNRAGWLVWDDVKDELG
jgi:PHD/YefM family antitoxin component YafN of YafNO toxin-antitoxin module